MADTVWAGPWILDKNKGQWRRPIGVVTTGSIMKVTVPYPLSKISVVMSDDGLSTAYVEGPKVIPNQVNVSYLTQVVPGITYLTKDLEA